MGTRSNTLVYDGDRNSSILVQIYGQWDGYVEDGLGDSLRNYLQNITIVDGISGNSSDNKNVANGMGCLAAQLVAFLKKGEAGGFYLTPVESCDTQEYNYHVYLQDGKVCLDVEHDGKVRRLTPTSPTTIIEFVYPTNNPGSTENLWRKLELVERNKDYICGFDLNDSKSFKRFRVDKIVGGNEKVFVTVTK